MQFESAHQCAPAPAGHAAPDVFHFQAAYARVASDVVMMRLTQTFSFHSCCSGMFWRTSKHKSKISRGCLIVAAHTVTAKGTDPRRMHG